MGDFCKVPSAHEGGVRQFAVLFVPHFRLQAAMSALAGGADIEEAGAGGAYGPGAEGATDGEVALLDVSTARGLVLEMGLGAAKAGVEVGMGASQALARCPGLRLVAASPGAEDRLGRALLTFAQTLSPRVESQKSDRCILDLRGIQPGGSPVPMDRKGTRVQDWEGWGGRALERLKGELGVKGVLGMAPSPALAWCAARRADPVRVVAEPEAFLETLTFEELEVSASLLEVLGGWGIGTLGELLRLPRQAALERLGSEAVSLWELARDSRESVLRLEGFEEPLQSLSDFENPVETLEPVLFVLNRLIEGFCSRMRLLNRVAAGMFLQLQLENGGAYERFFAVPAPTREESVLLRILETHLETLQMEAALVGVFLKIEETLPSSEQLALFEAPLRDPNRFGETLARLRALAGEARVGVPVRGETHRSDVHSMVDPLKVFVGGEARKPVEDAPGDGVCLLGLPLRRFRPRVPVQVRLRQHRPVHVSSSSVSGPVLECRGPYRISGEWWERTCWEREEWDVSIGGGQRGLYRLTHLCDPGGEPVREAPCVGEWSLEGCYDAAQWHVPPVVESKPAEGA